MDQLCYIVIILFIFIETFIQATPVTWNHLRISMILKFVMAL